MSFFDNKEEVLKLELTQEGKYLISQGIFKPKYYSFFDDDILYDSQYAQVTESQNVSMDRIHNETVYCKPQVNFTGAAKRYGKKITSFNSNIYSDSFSNENTSNNMPYPIGTSDHAKINLPAWDVSVYENKIKSAYQAKDYNPDSSYNYLNIPEINFHTSSMKFMNISNDMGTKEGYSSLFSYENGTIISMQENMSTTIEIGELNSLNEGYTVEIFIEETEKVGDKEIKYWKKLRFLQKSSLIQNNILLDVDENIVEVDEIMYRDLGSSAVDTYLNVSLDVHIPEIDNDFEYDIYGNMNKTNPPYGSMM